MYSFWDAIDISTNIQRGLAAIRGVRGLPALVLMLALGAINYGLFWLVWAFDIASTLNWSSRAADQISAMVSGGAGSAIGQYAGYVVLSITLLPTLVELFGSIFAKAQIAFASGLVFSLALFDMITDWPMVVQFFDAFTDAADRGGAFGWLAFYLMRIIWLFMASFGFEALLVVFGVAMIALLFQFSSGARAMRRAESE